MVFSFFANRNTLSLMTNSYDVIVIGAGIVGLNIAYQLARRSKAKFSSTAASAMAVSAKKSSSRCV